MKYKKIALFLSLLIYYKLMSFKITIINIIKQFLINNYFFNSLFGICNR